MLLCQRYLQVASLGISLGIFTVPSLQLYYLWLRNSRAGTIKTRVKKRTEILL